METRYPYWPFIEEYLPDYSRRDDVLMSDILARFLDNEEIAEEDADMIASVYGNNKDLVRQELLGLDKGLMAEAMEAYFAQSA